MDIFIVYGYPTPVNQNLTAQNNRKGKGDGPRIFSP